MLVKDKLIIRTIEKEDLDVLYRWNSQQARGLYQEFEFSSLVNITKEFEKNGFDTEKFKMLILELQDFQCIGLVYINFVREGLVRIGLVICEERCRNKGYGLKATNMIVRYLFDNYPIVRIEADTDHQNLGAMKVLEKSGFQREGVLRNYRYHHGQWRDFVMYSILKSDLSKNEYIHS